MYSKRGAAIVFGMFVVLAFSLCVGAAECYDLADGANFGAANDGNEITLCTGAYLQAVSISDINTMFVLDCSGSTLTGGASITNSSGVKIKNCLFKSSSVGVSVVDSIDLTLNNNTFENPTTGTSLQSVLRGSIRHNTFKNAKQGLVIADSMYLIPCAYNEFINNKIGLQLSNSTGNQIFKNVFIKSTASGSVCAKVIGAESASNVWDFSGEGNFWSDYAGNDTNDNGIGDTPYVISSEFGENKDNAPFMRRDLTRTDVPEAKIIGELVNRSGKYLFTIGDAVNFTCGASDTYVLVLAETMPELVVYVNSKAITLTKYSSTTIDLNADGTADVSVVVLGYGKADADIEIHRLNPCYYYCGDAACTAGETAATCPSDCGAGQEYADTDGDNWTIAAGDCDDADNSIYPGAVELCKSGIDYDCDGYAGELDTDCQGLGAGFWVLIILFVLLTGATVFFYFWKRKSEPKLEELPPVAPAKEEITTHRPSKPTVAPSEKTKRIIDYAEDYFEKGYSTKQVKEVLLTQGWSAEDIDAAIEEYIKQKAKGD